MNYDSLFEPLVIGEKLTLSNRLVMAPMTTTAGEDDGRFSTEEISYLKRRAVGGIGLIMTPACYVHKSGHAFLRQVGCDSDRLLPRLAECAQAINDTGAASFLQIHHGGNAAKEEYTGQQPWAPSAVRNRRGTSERPAAMSEAQIEEVIAAFADGADRARRAGFTGIELHGANTYLLQQFFSPYTNRRDDRWGTGSWDDRTRFAREVVRAVRAAVGPDYPISYRISPEEEDPDGYSTVDTIKLLKAIVPLGVDIVHVSSWEYGKGVRDDYPSDTHPTAMIRRAMPDQVPVVGVGGIFKPAEAVRVRDDGVELVALGRALLIEPDWGIKAREGRHRDIRDHVETREEVHALEVPPLMKEYLEKFFLAG